MSISRERARGPAPLRLDGLTKYYGHSPAVVDVSLELRPGEVCGYLGPNGAGKTTTLRVLMGFLRATAGAAEVFGLDAWREAPRIHQRVGYVAGEVALYEQMTGGELLAYLARLRGGVDRTVVAGLADRLAADLTRPIRALSKGNRQKIAILQALMHRPQLLILDEPTSGLDPLVQQQVHQLLREHAASGGSVLLSSHALSEVQLVADRVAIIRAGRLVAVERLDELRRNSLHRVRVEFADQVEPAEFGLEGVHDLRVSGTVLTCAAAQAALDPLLRRVTRHRVIDLACEEPSLDEAFLAYYDQAAAHAA